MSKTPFLLVQVDRQLIRNHNELGDPRILAFVRQLILLSSHHADPSARRELRRLLSVE